MVQIHRKITKVNFNNRNTNPKYIAIHYVGAVSTAANNATYFYSTYRGASANYFVDEKEIWQVVEDNDTAWAVGGSVYKNTKHPYYGIAKNSNTLSIEMCVKKKNGKWYYEPKTIEYTAWLVQQLMKKYSIPAKNVIRHYDVTGKPCPANYLDDTSWKSLHSQLTGQSNQSTSKPAEKPSTVTGVESYNGYITIIYDGSDGVSYHKTADFNSNSVVGVVKKGTILTIKGRVKVGSTYMYQTISGWFITSSTKYVKFSTTDPRKSSSNSSSSSSKKKINEDGVWGVDTTKLAQKVFGTTVDGKISNQSSKYKSSNPGLSSSTFEWKSNPTGGSALIKAIQKWCGTPSGKIDGRIGPDLIKRMQKKLGTPQDGKVSNPSSMVKAFQAWLNKQ